MKKILYLWPLLLAPIVGFLNIDFIVIPLLKSRGLAGFHLIGSASFLATLELAFWYWFWGWIGKLLIHVKTISEDIEFSKETIASDIKKNGSLNRLLNYFAKKYHWLTNNDHRAIRWIKRGGHVSLFAVGFFPEPASRMIGVVFCRSLHWKMGFYSLALGNIFHILYIIGGWNLVFWLFNWFFK